jgi:hypothetical protein
MARLPRLIGRALEALLVADDTDAALADRYVNRVAADDRLEQRPTASHAAWRPSTSEAIAENTAFVDATTCPTTGSGWRPWLHMASGSDSELERRLGELVTPATP